MTRRTAYSVWIATALMMGGACAKQPSPSLDMTSHFSQAHSVHTAIMFGNLDAARSYARTLATHENVSIPSGSQAWVDRMKQASIHVADAWHLEAAAEGTGDIVAACGSCHRAFDAGPTVGAVWEPDQLPGARAHMDRHRWALDRMWDGLMIPSDERWVQGAEALREESAQSPQGPTQLRGPDRTPALGGGKGPATRAAGGRGVCGRD